MRQPPFHRKIWYTLTPVIDLVIRTLPANSVTPTRAYASLRAQTPGRSSYLIESSATGAASGRYSLLGYRTRGESVFPGGGNAIELLAGDLVNDEVTPGLAARISQSLVGYIAYDAVHALRGIEPWPDESDLARMMRDSTAVVFDAVEKTMTIAGRSKGAVDRCEWEMTHGPELKDLPSIDPEAEAEHADAQMEDAMFLDRVARARKHIASGAADRIVFARLFKAPLRGSEPFDVYRALRVLDPAPYHFFFEFADTPMAEGLVMAGSAASGDLLSATDATEDAARSIEALFPAESMVGSPTDRVPAIIRELEPSARGMFGGAVGYLGPRGVIELALATTSVVMKRGFYETRGSITLTKDSERGREVDDIRRAARPVLAAIRAAQEAAKAP